MSLIDDILITIDDKPGITKEEILAINENNIFNKQAIYSAIARLNSRGFIINKKLSYNITIDGKSRIDYFLDSLESFKNSHKKWHLILVEIPEKEKLKREKLRYEFKKIGIGMLKRGVYIFYNHDLKNVNDVLNHLNLISKSLILPVQINNQVLSTILKNSWEISELNAKYLNYINTFQKFEQQISSLPKEIQRIEAKKAVFNFSKILLSDPKIINDSYQSNYLRTQCLKIYNVIQPYCYL